jgi:hypothetical protein
VRLGDGTGVICALQGELGREAVFLLEALVCLGTRLLHLFLGA